MNTNRLIMGLIVVVGVPLATIGYIAIMDRLAGLLPENVREKVRPWLWTGPVLFLLVFYLIYPTINTIYLSFFNADSTQFIGVKNYIYIFTNPDPYDVEEGQDWTANLNPSSLQILKGSKVEPALTAAQVGDRFQFMRQGYFCVDPDAAPDAPVFNQTVSLRDSWAKVQRKAKQ